MYQDKILLNWELIFVVANGPGFEAYVEVRRFGTGKIDQLPLNGR
jgi:hypothetical protein